MSKTKDKDKENEPGHLALWGVGDQGIRTISSISEDIRRLARPLAVDTDPQTLVCSPVSRKLKIGRKSPPGSGTPDPESALRESEEKIREHLGSARTLLLVGGLGGGLASSVIPGLCRLARKMKITPLVFATRPFAFEGKRRERLFREARERIVGSGAGLACFSLDRLVGKVEDDTPHGEVFELCDRTLREAVEMAVAFHAAPPGQGVDSAALAGIFGGPGETVLGSETAGGPEGLVKAAKGAISTLSLSPAELARVRGILVQVDGPEEIPFRQVQKAVGAVSRLLAEETEFLHVVTRFRKPEDGIGFRILAAGVPDGTAAGSPLPVTLTADRPPPRQKEIDFNRFARGIFADTEPNLREGEDLDIPTFARKGVILDED